MKIISYVSEFQVRHIYSINHRCKFEKYGNCDLIKLMFIHGCKLYERKSLSPENIRFEELLFKPIPFGMGGPCYLKTASLSSNEDANTTVHINSLVVVHAAVEEDTTPPPPWLAMDPPTVGRYLFYHKHIQEVSKI